MSDELDALRASVTRLRRIVESTAPDQLERQAYPTEWTVADVLSHLGSGAEIYGAWLEDGLAGTETPADFAPSVWDDWNAKSSAQRASDALTVNEQLVHRLESLTEDERASFGFNLGAMTVGYSQFIRLRLNEQALHTWDIEVAFDPAAAVGEEAVPLVVDNLEMITRYAGKPTGREDSIAIQTETPRRDFRLALHLDSVSLEPSDAAETPGLELPAEALIRLVYGRLDPAHTPPVSGSADLDQLREMFRGA